MPNYSHLNRDRRKHTNLTNEITGSYYEDKRSYALYGVIAVIIILCGLIYYFGFVKVETVTVTDGCIASAYQATKNGGDLEANLSVCER